MDRKQIIESFWHDVASQNACALKSYFTSDAYIRWNNTNEQFTANEFIIANCEYPGDWQGEIERVEEIGDTMITATRVWLTNQDTSFHVASFFEFVGDKISVLNEYWGDDGSVPQWRVDKHIGKCIK